MGICEINQSCEHAKSVESVDISLRVEGSAFKQREIKILAQALVDALSLGAQSGFPNEIRLNHKMRALNLLPLPDFYRGPRFDIANSILTAAQLFTPSEREQFQLQVHQLIPKASQLVYESSESMTLTALIEQNIHDPEHQRILMQSAHRILTPRALAQAFFFAAVVRNGIFGAGGNNPAHLDMWVEAISQLGKDERSLFEESLEMLCDRYEYYFNASPKQNLSQQIIFYLGQRAWFDNSRYQKQIDQLAGNEFTEAQTRYFSDNLSEAVTNNLKTATYAVVENPMEVVVVSAAAVLGGLGTLVASAMPYVVVAGTGSSLGLYAAAYTMEAGEGRDATLDLAVKIHLFVALFGAGELATKIPLFIPKQTKPSNVIPFVRPNPPAKPQANPQTSASTGAAGRTRTSGASSGLAAHLDHVPQATRGIQATKHYLILPGGQYLETTPLGAVEHAATAVIIQQGTLQVPNLGWNTSGLGLAAFLASSEAFSEILPDPLQDAPLLDTRTGRLMGQWEKYFFLLNLSRAQDPNLVSTVGPNSISSGSSGIAAVNLSHIPKSMDEWLYVETGFRAIDIPERQQYFVFYHLIVRRYVPAQRDLSVDEVIFVKQVYENFLKHGFLFNREYEHGFFVATSSRLPAVNAENLTLSDGEVVTLSPGDLLLFLRDIQTFALYSGSHEFLVQIVALREQFFPTYHLDNWDALASLGDLGLYLETLSKVDYFGYRTANPSIMRHPNYTSLNIDGQRFLALLRDYYLAYETTLLAEIGPEIGTASRLSTDLFPTAWNLLSLSRQKQFDYVIAIAGNGLRVGAAAELVGLETLVMQVQFDEGRAQGGSDIKIINGEALKQIPTGSRVLLLDSDIQQGWPVSTLVAELRFRGVEQISIYVEYAPASGGGIGGSSAEIIRQLEVSGLVQGVYHPRIPELWAVYPSEVMTLIQEKLGTTYGRASLARKRIEVIVDGIMHSQDLRTQFLGIANAYWDIWETAYRPAAIPNRPDLRLAELSRLEAHLAAFDSLDDAIGTVSFIDHPIWPLMRYLESLQIP